MALYVKLLETCSGLVLLTSAQNQLI